MRGKRFVMTGAAMNGSPWALEFLVRNQQWSAAEALEYGLINQLCADETALRDAARTLAEELAAGPTRAFGELKRLFHSTWQQPLEAQLDAEAVALARTSKTDDAWGALNAVSAKQTPVFKGR